MTDRTSAAIKIGGETSDALASAPPTAVQCDDAIADRDSGEDLPLSRERASAIIDAAPRDPFGFKTDLTSQMTQEEIVACGRYWHSAAPGSWSFNDVIYRCATPATLHGRNNADEVLGSDRQQQRVHTGTWDEHPTYLLVDWKYEVASDDTRLGYWDWVAAQESLAGRTLDRDESTAGCSTS